MLIGYARVSTIDQNIQYQIDLLKAAGCEKILTDCCSGIREDRPGLKQMLEILRDGDTVIIYKTDRLFRSLKNMVDLVDILNSKNGDFKSLTEPIFDTSSANGKFLIQIFGAVSEFERNLISSERTKSGLENAKQRRKVLGRPKGFKTETIQKYDYALHLYSNKKKSIDKACEIAQISKTTFYRIDNFNKEKLTK